MIKLSIGAVVLILISGMFDGLNQAYIFHFPEVQDVFPNLLPNSEAWRFKYLNGDPNQGPKFFGSTTFLAWTTDLYHFTRMIVRVCFMLGFVLAAIEIRLRGVFKNWKTNLLGVGKMTGYYLIWMLGFHLVYTLVF